MLNLITNGIAWLVKNLNLVTGVLGALAKAVTGFINIIQPGRDSFVDKISSWTEKIQSALFKITQFLNSVGK